MGKYTRRVVQSHRPTERNWAEFFAKFLLLLLLLLLHGGNAIQKVHGGRWQATFDMRTLPERKRRPGGGQLGEEHVPEAFPNSRMTDECRHEGMNETRKGTCPINQ